MLNCRYHKSKEGETVLFRCELDALPIEEINSFEHRSLINGVSHKCGHDGHEHSMRSSYELSRRLKLEL
jgi:metal-dependent amidase/aminoacylase/carboxypeptidase family protein